MLLNSVDFKGGLVTYISDKYSVEVLKGYENSNSWEGQFFNIKGGNLNSAIALVNMYVPPRGRDNFLHFQNEFFPVLHDLTDKFKHILIAGDSNADALKISSQTLII